MYKRIVIPALLVSGLLIGNVFGQMLTYNEARVLALKDENSSPKEYVDKLVTFYFDFARKVMPGCAQGVDNVETALVSVVSRIDSEGNILHTWNIGHETMTTCFLESFTKQTLPPPPYQPYYTIVDLRGDPKKL